jgi:hypothetical protein
MDTMTALPKGTVMPATLQATDITGLNDQCAELLRRVAKGIVPLGVAVKAVQAGIENNLETIVREPQYVFDRFTPVEQYQDRIRARACLQGWELPWDQLAAIGQATDYHAGPLEPASISYGLAVTSPTTSARPWLGSRMSWKRPVSTSSGTTISRTRRSAGSPDQR